MCPRHSAGKPTVRKIKQAGADDELGSPQRHRGLFHPSRQDTHPSLRNYPTEKLLWRYFIPRSFQAERKRLVKIATRISPESDHGCRPRYPGNLGNAVRNHICQLLMVAHPHDGYQINIASNRVALSNAVDIGYRSGDLGDLPWFGIYQNDCS